MPTRIPPACLRLLALAIVVATTCAAAQPEKPPASEDAAEGVIVSGVKGSFDATRAAVEQARRSSGRVYRVVVVASAGDAGDVYGLLDRLVARWQELGDHRFDPTADVTIVLDVAKRRLAMDVPRDLKTSAGLEVETVERELITKLFRPLAQDGRLDEGIAALVNGTEAWAQARAEERRAREEATRVFRTRTLPIGAAAAAGTAALAAFAALWLRHARRLAAARARLAAFKADVVALSDMLDAQQERHRLLPHADPDFKTPMEGLTRAAYDGVQDSLRTYRERWLALMDVWERAQDTITKEWLLGTRAADAVIALLDDAGARPPLAEVAGACRGPLDALEQAHEKARELRAALDTEATATAARVGGLARRGRSGAAWQPPLVSADRARERAADVLERDPIAARGILEEAAATLARVREQAGAVEAGDDRRARAEGRAAAVAADVAARRADGWLLAEPGANPDDLVGRSRRECGLAAQLLDAGDATGAAAALDRAEHAGGEAAALVESIVAARARGDELAAPAAARLEALAAGRDAAAEAAAHLARSYADRSWSDVADNVGRIDEGLDRVRTLLAEARTAAEPSRQHSFRAVALLEEAGRQEEWVAGCAAALAERRAQLDGLRDSLPARRSAVADRVAALASGLERQRTDRPRANERCREAARMLEAAGAALASARPDPVEAGRLVQAADDAAARAAELADEDDRLARQAEGEIADTEDLVRRAAAWYDEGVQPDLRAARQSLAAARAMLDRQRYEDAIRTAGEAASAARAAYAEATTEAARRRTTRQEQLQRRRLEESFSRSAGGAGPWVITLPGGSYGGPDPWRSLTPAPAPTRHAGGSWSRDVATGTW